MSYVTNTILTFSILEGDSDHRDVLERVNAYFLKAVTGFIIPSSDAWYGGTKVLERPTFFAAFNYLNLEKFVEHLRALDWKEPEEVQLIVCEEHDNEYRIIWPCRVAP